MLNMNIDATTVQWLTSAYALTEAVVIPVAAWFMGKFKSKHLFASVMLLFFAGAIVSALSNGFGILLLGRILQAAAAGIGMVMVMALIMLAFPREHRGKAMGVVSLVIGFAPAVGPFAGGLVVDLWGWRTLFVAVAILSVIIAIAALIFMGEDDGFPRTRFDILSVILSSVGLVSLLYGISSFASAENIVIPLVLIVFGIAVIALFAKRQLTMKEPLLRLDAFKSARYRAAIITVVFLQAILIGLVVLMPIYVQNVLGYSATVSGLVILPGAFLGALAGLLAGRIFDRFGIRILSLIGAALLVISGIGMFSYSAASPLWFVIAANALNGICIQLLVTPLITWGINSLSNDLVQHATAVTNTMNQVGGATGTALIMLFSAIGSALSLQSDSFGRMLDGCHMSYGVVLAFSVIVFALVGLYVRKLSKVEQPEIEHAYEPEAPYQLVREIMSNDLLSLPKTTLISAATKQLSSANASGAVLTNSANEVCGFISNSDILRYFSNETDLSVSGGEFAILSALEDSGMQERIADAAGTAIGDIATRSVISIDPEATLEDACNLIAKRKLKILPVIKDSKALGVVHRRSLMASIAQAIEDFSPAN